MIMTNTNVNNIILKYYYGGIYDEENYILFFEWNRIMHSSSCNSCIGSRSCTGRRNNNYKFYCISEGYNYWTKTTTKLNSVYGTASNISTVSSGSVSGSNPQILKIEVYSRVSSGSDSFYLYVEDGNGNVNYTTVSKSGTITINDFNGFDPSGKWKIWIVTKGTVSTSTETIKVYYTY